MREIPQRNLRWSSGEDIAARNERRTFVKGDGAYITYEQFIGVMSPNILLYACRVNRIGLNSPIHWHKYAAPHVHPPLSVGARSWVRVAIEAILGEEIVGVIEPQHPFVRPNELARRLGRAGPKDLARPGLTRNFGPAGCRARLGLQKYFAGQPSPNFSSGPNGPGRATHIYSSTTYCLVIPLVEKNPRSPRSELETIGIDVGGYFSLRHFRLLPIFGTSDSFATLAGVFLEGCGSICTVANGWVSLEGRRRRSLQDPSKTQLTILSNFNLACYYAMLGQIAFAASTSSQPSEDFVHEFDVISKRYCEEYKQCMESITSNVSGQEYEFDYHRLKNALD
ncbi:hypothetical protein PanWU01x14_047380 [Parasponia andersonii]|uniref:Uncharacterized protein n=1 Tax=Parasponia andersonii TaxID=3476 RepID=A0A2P5DN09_PARAD|nr:hypothetical protein PanWU01x14_047380 [Parasponia andersonii]